MVAVKSESRSIAHLLRRAGFGATPGELRHYENLGYSGTVDELLNPARVDNTKLEEDIKQQNFDFTRLDDLKRWWIYRMTFSQRPLEEKMTLFWHGHFATSARKVRSSYLMYMQNLLFRQNAVADFHRLLLGVSRDPAMILWLDNQQNRKGKPNENYAREIMELFTLGIGNYSERDIKDAARAFTGWQVRNGMFAFNRFQHDFGQKTVLGASGDLNGDEVVGVLVRHPATAQFLARKLVKFFVCDPPDESMVNAAADAYRSSRFQIAPMLRAIFTHPGFLSERAYHSKIKSPSELVVGTLKTLQVHKLDNNSPATLARMGQNLFEPPNVKGWDGGAAWVSTAYMMERFNFAASVVADKFDELQAYYSPVELAGNYELKTAGQMVDYFLNLLVDNDVPRETRARLVAYVSGTAGGQPSKEFPDDTALDTKLRGVVRLIMTLPSYQLA